MKASLQTQSFIRKRIKEIRKGGGKPQHLVAQLLNQIEDRLKNNLDLDLKSITC